MGNAKAGSDESERSHPRAGIDEIVCRWFPHMQHNRADFGIPRAREFDVNQRLLLVHHQLTGGEREDICPNVTSCKKIIDSGYGMKIRSCNSRCKIAFLHDT